MLSPILVTYFVFKGAFFAGLVKAFTMHPSTKKAIVFGIIYTVGVGGLSAVWLSPEMLAAMGLEWDTRPVWLMWNLGLSTLYFLLLDWFEDAGAVWWLILAAGVGLVLF
jgi:hypothetical protein